MKIQHIRIENFRSVKRLDFAPGTITALVGPNNAGKTNILAALNFLLGERFPMSQGLDDKDFSARRGTMISWSKSGSRKTRS